MLDFSPPLVQNKIKTIKTLLRPPPPETVLEDKTQSSSNKQNPQGGWGWFLSAGVGGVTDFADDTYFSGILRAGLILPSSNADLTGSRATLSLDFGITPYDKTASKPPISVNVKGQFIDFTLNYNANFPLNQSEAFKLYLIFGSGIGGQFQTGTITTTIGGIPQSTEASAKAFIMNLNFGLRGVFAKNHAIDLLFKPNLATFASANGASMASYFDHVKFYVAYTFLKF